MSAVSVNQIEIDLTQQMLEVEPQDLDLDGIISKHGNVAEVPLPFLLTRDQINKLNLIDVVENPGD